MDLGAAGEALTRLLSIQYLHVESIKTFKTSSSTLAMKTRGSTSNTSIISSLNIESRVTSRASSRRRTLRTITDCTLRTSGHTKDITEGTDSTGRS